MASEQFVVSELNTSAPLAPWEAEPSRLWSLMELLRFHAEKYVRLVRELKDLEAHIWFDKAEEVDPVKAAHNAKERRSMALAGLSDARGLAGDMGLEVAVKHIDELVVKAKAEGLAENDVTALIDGVARELSCRVFVAIPVSRRRLFDGDETDWIGVIRAFGNAQDDIDEMNKCYALSRYPAAVLHSLLVVEHGLVWLGKELGSTDPKEGWDAACKQLERLLKAGRAANTTRIDFSTLEQLNATVQAMKHAWRNKINHATGKPLVMHGGFAPHVAEEIITAARAFMRRLAEVKASLGA